MQLTDPPFVTEEHRALRDQLRRFVAAEIRPHAAQWEEEGATPRTLLRRMGELGFLGIRLDPEYGGSGMDPLGSVILAEELGRSGFGGVAITVLVHTDMASPHLAHAGTPEQKARWLPRVVSGEAITAIAVTEPGAGSDVAGLATRARRDNQGWVLEGRKLYITNGVLGDLTILAARTDPAAKPSRGITLFLVPRGTPGLRVARQLDKSGWRSSDTAELEIDGLRLTDADILGEPDRGFHAIMHNFQNERLVLGAQALGEAQRALEITLDWLRTRQAFGAPLWQRQAIRQRLAARWSEIAAARALVYQTAAQIAAGQDCRTAVSAIKALCGELVNRVMYDCQQFHGGAGYMSGTEIERLVRDARVQSIGGGATEVMLEEVAKGM